MANDKHKEKDTVTNFLDLYDSLEKIEDEMEDALMALDDDSCMESKLFKFILLTEGEDKTVKQLKREVNEKLFHLSVKRENITEKMGELKNDFYKHTYGF
jgi:hypothetical protein